jgi:serine/threonine-protein kinase
MTQTRERTVGSFQVERELGEGGMGVVLLARHRELDRAVVLKKLRRDMASNPELVKRFHREARAAAAVHHQNVVSVYDCFSFKGDYYIAQEFVGGVDLRTALARGGRIPHRVAVLIALEVLRGLEEIHAHGTVHRDLKPGNILLGRGGEVKIGDFGIALEGTGSALTQPGVMLGTPPYMPPEQILGDRVDARGDLFSLGVVFYEMLAGRPPFREPTGEEQETLLRQVQRGHYPPLSKLAPEVPRYLPRLIRVCLHPRPKYRIASATAIRVALERRIDDPLPAYCRAEIATWIAEREIVQPEEGATVFRPAVKVRPRRRRKALRWAAVGLLFALLFSTALFVRFDLQELIPVDRLSGTPEAEAPE